MPSTTMVLQQCLQQKDEDRNLVSAGFYMITITLISMSMVDLNWFVITSDVCVPYLTLGQFFWFGYSPKPIDAEYSCINGTIVNMMRIMILLSFMCISFALAGFFLEIIGPHTDSYRMIRRYAVPGIFTVLWILVIISFSYYIVLLLEDSIEKNYPKTVSSVTYGLGFYLVAAAGGITSMGIIYSLAVLHQSALRQLHGHRNQHDDDDRCIIDSFDDGLDTFNTPIPPPPYNIPPPPYTP